MGTDILCLRLGATHVVAVSSPEIAREFLRKKDAMFTGRPATLASNLFSYGYKCASLAIQEHKWQKMKRIVAAEILSLALDRRLHVQRQQEADHLIRYVYAEINAGHGGSINLRHVTQHFCANMIRRLVLGKRHFSESPGTMMAGHHEVEHVQALFTLVEYMYGFCLSDYFPALVGFDLDGHEKVAKRVISVLERLHDPIIQERMLEWSNYRRKGCSKRDAADFLDVLISLEDADGQQLLSPEEIKAQEMLFAAIDNPSNAVQWALAEMMNRPRIMQKAVDELDQVVGKERLVQESDICKLNYLKSCIREAFRLHPYHAFTVPRVAIQDTVIAGYTIPKGTHVLLSRIGLGRNAKAWNEPLQFQPERHLTDGDVDLTETDLRFISFSAGRRGCPAASLGTSITMMLFARLLQGFTWAKLPRVDRINLQEARNSLVLAEPLVLLAKPRLGEHLYEVN
ncbi:hypothetical protein HU200_045469 [Digitaria exilis]|uniref:Cytochrome P450 n=1 Tax=Digitaria exilis TaxID=1010633 RepID=A0A835B0E8_9POAL|nr:hypothetical protein HU200_045469 [Digitaria exilis]